jgi:hypothetical protein
VRIEAVRFRESTVALLAARLVGINNFRTGFDGIERIGTVEAFGLREQR